MVVKFVEDGFKGGELVSNGINADIKEDKYTRKDDKGKTQWDLVDFSLLEGVPKVLEYGLEKYGKRDSWKGIEDPKERYRSAALRHMFAYMNGEEKDSESGLSHLQHVMCNIYFLQFFENSDKNEK